MPADAVLAFVLDRPEQSNALGAAEWTRLLGTLRDAEDAPHARALAIESRGRALSAGNDLSETRRFSTRGDARRYFLDLMLPTLAAMASSRLPVVAAVDGPALGGGLELLQYCDIVVASTEATFGLPETGVGLWATIHLATSAYVGDRRVAQRLALTGDIEHALPAARRALSELIAETLFEAEAVEGMAAFDKKRPPVF